MKKSILALTLICALLTLGFSSCEKVKDTLFPAFETEPDEVAVTIPITIEGVESSISSTVSFNLDSVIKAYTANTFSIENLSSVKVKDAAVFLTNADALNDISNFEKVAIKFSSNTVTTPAVVASATVPDSPATNINITASDSPELKEYLNGNQLTYTVTSKARRTTTKPLNALVYVTLSIK